MESNQPMDINALINWKQLRYMAQEDDEFALELLQLFVEDNQPFVEAAKQALVSQDAAIVAQTAHKIKGSSANIGAPMIQTVAEQLERAAKTNQLESMTVRLRELENLIKCIQGFLDSGAVHLASQ